MKIFYTFFAISILSVLVISCDNILNKDLIIGTSAIKNSNGRNDLWGFTGPGGGGALFNPAINPSDPKNVFVSSDMTGSFVTYDGGEKWRMFNLRSVTKFYSFDIKDANIVYAGTSDLLFKSIDKGVSWETIYPLSKDIIAIHSQGDHANEVIITKDSLITEIQKLVVDPDNSQKLFLLIKNKKIDFWPKNQNRNQRFSMHFLVSEDGGISWNSTDKLPFNINNFFIDPKSPKTNRTLYVSGKDGLGMKKNGHWTNLGLPEGAGTITQFVDGIDTRNGQLIIYAISGQSYFNPNGKKDDSRIYMYNTVKMIWERIGESIEKYKMEGSNDPEFRSISTSYNHPNVIYISYDKLIINKDSVSIGVAKSINYGKTWELVSNDVNNIPSSNRKSGWLDERFGSGWGENPFHISIDKQNPNIIYTSDFGRIIKSIDGGFSWQQIYTNKIKDSGWKSSGLQVTTGYLLAYDPFDPLHVFMANTDTGLMESFDGAISWNSATYNNGIPEHWINSTYWIQFDPDVKDKVWALMSGIHDLPRPKMWKNKSMSEYVGGVLVSTDGGKNWKPTSLDIGETVPTHIIIDTKSNPDKRILYVCAFGKGVYKSDNGGVSWQNKNNGIEGSEPAAWRLTQKSNGDLFLIVSRKSDDGKIGNEKDGALYRSSDGAETWVKMNLPKGVNGPSSLIVDPRNTNRLILSAWGRYGRTKFSSNRGGGIYISENNGETWFPVLTKDQHINELTIDELSGVFYACGFNSSAYRSEDYGMTWERIKGYNFKWGKRVQPDPIDSNKIYIITYGGGIWHGPVKGDKNALEDIITSKTSYK